MKYFWSVSFRDLTVRTMNILTSQVSNRMFPTSWQRKAQKSRIFPGLHVCMPPFTRRICEIVHLLRRSQRPVFTRSYKIGDFPSGLSFAIFSAISPAISPAIFPWDLLLRSSLSLCLICSVHRKIRRAQTPAISHVHRAFERGLYQTRRISGFSLGSLCRHEISHLIPVF